MRPVGAFFGFFWFVAIFFGAALLLIGPLFGESWRTFLDRAGETTVLRVALGFLFLVVGVEALRRRSESLLGRGIPPHSQERRRQAVDILLRSLDSDRQEIRRQAFHYLRQLTGEDFGEDAGAWRAWWRERRSSFRFPMTRCPPAPPPETR